MVNTERGAICKRSEIEVKYPYFSILSIFTRFGLVLPYQKEKLVLIHGSFPMDIDFHYF